MVFSIRRLCFVAGVAALMVGVTGCGNSAPPMAVVNGQVVTADGDPCGNALVVFHPRGEGKVNGPKPVATADDQGRFVLTTHVKDDGAEPGEYGVTIVWNQPEKESKFSLSGEGGGGGPDKLSGRYGDPSNPKLTAVVEPGKENSFRFEVK